MSTPTDRQQTERVREQFTRTAEVFGDYAVAHRLGDAEMLARIVRASAIESALDVACGPGTLALRFSRHVRSICGLDLTPAILERARLAIYLGECDRAQAILSNPSGATEISIFAGWLLSFLKECGVPTGMLANVPAVATTRSSLNVNVISPSST